MRSPTLEQLLAEELELRAALLADANDDDQHAASCRIDLVSPCTEGLWPELWPCFSALAELRLVERRIYQLREAIRGA